VRVAEAAAAAGAESVMTGECASGTDRVAEAVLGRPGWDIAINVQGDEPRIAPENIDALVEGMRSAPSVGVATLCWPLPPERVADPNAVKVVRSTARRALYFSRSALPFPRNEEVAKTLWRLHLGIYGFRREALAAFVALPPSPLELAEGLEQLRALENGMDILVLDAPRPAFGVDTPEDLAEVERSLRVEDS
jgi:3-deoxy-manno-octulosonate cytidylyltransferase (CMP-KDO synthetase)